MTLCYTPQSAQHTSIQHKEALLLMSGIALFKHFLTEKMHFSHCKTSKKFWAGGAAPPTPRRGAAPGPRWGLRPQTPASVLLELYGRP